jgi:hypothetical protein
MVLIATERSKSPAKAHPRRAFSQRWLFAARGEILERRAQSSPGEDKAGKGRAETNDIP